MRIVLHQCCAPCSIYPLSRLIEDGAEVHGFIYNPNIHPEDEYKKRTDTLLGYNESQGVPYTHIDEYGLMRFIKMEAKMDDRCGGCYRMRLSAAAKYAAKNGFDTYSSTLLYSRRQKHELIRAIGEEIARLYGVTFWYEDYRKGWQVGIDISKKQGIYRQRYCGCIFSLRERGG